MHITFYLRRKIQLWKTCAMIWTPEKEDGLIIRRRPLQRFLVKVVWVWTHMKIDIFSHKKLNYASIKTLIQKSTILIIITWCRRNVLFDWNKPREEYNVPRSHEEKNCRRKGTNVLIYETQSTRTIELSILVSTKPSV